MRSTIEALVELPTPLKAVFGIMACTTLLGAVYILAGLSPMVIAVLLIGIVLVALLLVGYRLILKMRAKRKAKPFESDLAGNTGSVPQGVSEAASRARLDELRKKFEQGVEIFRQHGKDLYSLPWYMIVGEPGSGKTEALRHSNVGFPPGLQDELQGSGGTINMDWWFTNNAVILDTAGRLMFEEAASKSNTEWKEFLTLLAKHRPNCPINGLMLVIPADSLIRDSADEIANKGGRIARQLDLIQRTLGVRFPVFVLVTKADLILGFREFFDELNDPQLQHQILGWSNPSDLDEGFRPEMIEQHLETVRKRLERRRLGLLIDPVSKEGAMARRADEVDALYAFPDSLLSIAPRMRRYLELIFTGGEWSTKPLFLRGMYFVSSMREGSAMDAGLAEALGMSVDQLPEGKVWERDRSYFLRDLFLEKMFREQGLVTRTSNTSQLRRRRRAILLGTGCAAAALLIGLTWFGSQTLSRSIGEPARFWESAAAIVKHKSNEPPFPQVVAGELGRDADDRLLYTGRQSLSSIADIPGANESSVIALEERVASHVDRQIDVPLIFKAVAWIAPGDSSNLYSEARLEAGRDTYELTVLRPLVARAIRAASTTGTWSPEATGALAQMLNLASRQTGHIPTAELELQPLFRYVLRPEVTVSMNTEGETGSSGVNSQFALAAADIATLQEVLNALERPEGTWPGSVLLDVHRQPSAALRAAVDRFLESKRAIAAGDDESSELGRARRLVRALQQFRSIENELHETYAPLQNVIPPRDTSAWTQRYDALVAASNQIGRGLPMLGTQSLDVWYEAQAQASLQSLEDEFARLLAALPPAAPANPNGEGDGATLPPAAQELAGIRQDLTATLASLRQSMRADDALRAELVTLQETMLNARGSDQRPFEQRMACYQQTDGLLKSTRAVREFIELPIELETLTNEVNERKLAFDRLKTGNAPAKIDRAVTTCNWVLDLVLDQQRTTMVVSVLDSPSLPQTPNDVERAVGELAARRFEPRKHPDVPMTVLRGEGNFNQNYHQQAAPMMLRAIRAVESVLSTRGLANRASTLTTARNEYGRWYVEYWRDVIAKEGGLRRFDSWSTFHNGLTTIRAADVNTTLDQLAETRIAGLSAMIVDRNDWSPDVVTATDSALNRVRQEQLKLRNKNEYERACVRWLTNWSELGASAGLASRRLLEFELVRFNNDFVHLAVESAGSPPVDYWRMLSIGAVTTLAADINQSFDSAFQTLRSLRRFPLGPLPDGVELSQLETTSAGAPTRVLSVEEVVSARNAVAILRPAAGRTNGAAGGSGSSLAQASTLTGIDPIDTAIRQLRGGSLAQADRDTIDSIAAVLQTLPADPRRPQPITMTVLGSKPSSTGDTAASIRFPYLQVTEDRPSGEFQHEEKRITGTQAIGDIEIPAGLTMNFYLDQSSGRRANIVRIAGPWAVLALLHRYDGRPSREDPQVWEVEIMVNEGGTRYPLWLQFRFDVPPPPLDAWPD